MIKSEPAVEIAIKRLWMLTVAVHDKSTNEIVD